jgi:hypothetical protein
LTKSDEVESDNALWASLKNFKAEN